MAKARRAKLQTEKITPAQIRKLFALARELGLDHEDLRGMAYSLAGAEGVSRLTKGDAMRLIDRLEGRAKKDYRPTAASRQQLHKIDRLAAELGWSDNPRRLEGFVKRTAGVDKMRWLDYEGASKVIEGMKSMVKQKKNKTSEMKS